MQCRAGGGGSWWEEGGCVYSVGLTFPLHDRKCMSEGKVGINLFKKHNLEPLKCLKSKRRKNFLYL